MWTNGLIPNPSMLLNPTFSSRSFERGPKGWGREMEKIISSKGLETDNSRKMRGTMALESNGRVEGEI